MNITTEAELQELKLRLERTHNDITEILNDMERYLLERRKARAREQGRRIIAEPKIITVVRSGV
jgi:t-SNARE complex subunit (syntaxin)